MKTQSLKRVITTVLVIMALAGVAQAGEVTLAWDPNVEPDIAGYVVWYGTQSGVYTSRVDVGNRTLWTVSGLLDGQRYYFAVQAYNSSLLMSPLSVEVFTDLPGVVPPQTGGTTGGTTVACTTIQPGAGWTCVNGGWLPPGYPGTTSGTTSGATSGMTVACKTIQPGAGWTCVNGGWLPPGYPGTPSGTAVACRTVQPGAGWTCVNGGWLPPGMGSGSTASSTGGCTTPDPFVSLGGGTCVNGGWLPPGYNAAKSATSSPATTAGQSEPLYMYQLVEGSGLTGWVTLSPDPSGTGRLDAVRDNGKIGQWSSSPTVAGSQFMPASRTTDVNSPAAMDLVTWQPANGVWSVLKSFDGIVYTSQTSVQWGSVADGDLPVPGDFDGDGKTDLAIWRPSSATWYMVKSTDGYDIQRNVSVQWGESGDVPVQGDYDGDGKTDLAVWRPSSATWYVLRSTEGSDPQRAFAVRWGQSGDMPVQSGDYDGDGKADIALWRPSTSTSLVLKSSEGYSLDRCLAVQWGSGTAESPCPATIKANKSLASPVFVRQSVSVVR